MQNKEQLSKAENDFHFTISRFSHEIRNPVALIGSELQMIEDTHPEVTGYDCWNDIQDNLDYIKQLLNDLSDYNNAKRLILKKTPMTDYLNTILSSVIPTFHYLGIALEQHISPALPELPIDQVKMKQALLNLLRNAAEAITCSNGNVAFHARCVSGRLLISVKDNGCGISPEQLSEIFTPFITFKPEGTGLGLAITRQIIEAHNGSIKVSSSPGQGTSFQIALPLEP